MTAANHTPTPWVYVRSEPGLWTVGFYDPSGKWQSDSDHDSPEAAAERVGYLSGSNSHDALVAALIEADGHLSLLRAARQADPIEQSDFPRSLNLNDRETLAKAARSVAEALKVANAPQNVVANLNKAPQDALVAACDAAMQCIGELSPTQARVEVAQLLQAALNAAKAAP